MKEKGFTLFEILIALSALVILLSIAIFSYNNIIDKARRSVCETNLKVLKTAIEYYGMEYDALPATLGQLGRDHFERAFAQVTGENPWSNMFYSNVAKLGYSGESHAAFLTYDNLSGRTTEDHFKDPDDSNGGVSYGINSSLVGKKWSEIDDNTVIVADSDNYTFTSLNDIIKRHSRGITGEHIAMAITKGQEIYVFAERLNTGTDTTTSDDINRITASLDDLMNANLSTAAADKAEDVRNKLWTAISELSKTSSDTIAAKGLIDSAQADLQAMINDGLIDSTTGSALINQLQTISNIL